MFERGTPSPYFMAAVSILVSLVQGLPLASMFKVYQFLICEVYDRKLANEPIGGDSRGYNVIHSSLSLVSQSTIGALGSAASSMGIQIPPAPSLPHPPQCDEPRVQKSTSAYAAAMETTGALVALILLNRVTKISRRVGRKPMLLLPQIMIALGFAAFRLAVALPDYIGIVVLFVALVSMEASGAGPLKVGLQNYVVDTTTDSQRAAALGFIDGVGQLGAFPSSTLGGLLAAVTGQFFAPFYTAIGLAMVSLTYILIFVPESKRNRHHTFIDNWEHSEEATQRQERRAARLQQQQQMGPDNSRRQSYRTVSYQASESEASVYSTDAGSGSISWRRLLSRVNFLAPLAIFLPRRRRLRDHHDRPLTSQSKKPLDFRLLNLAFIVIVEESYQVFLVPMLLLYNSDVFGFDVLQNGYLVSLLQGVRALFLTLVFPPAVAWARRRISVIVARRKQERKRRLQERMKNRQQQPPDDERSSLLREDGNQQPPSASNGYGATGERDAEEIETAPSEYTSTTVAKAEERGKLDLFLLIFSYGLATASFLILAFSRRFAAGQGLPGGAALVDDASNTNKRGPWICLIAGIVGLQVASGGTSVRTALIVNGVHTESEQSKALAATQVLCSVVYASLPLVTSLVYGAGLAMDLPELVWLFKAGFAALATLGGLALFITHRGAAAEAVAEHREGQQGRATGGGDEGGGSSEQRR